MYDIGDLFDRRSAVGAKLEQFMMEKTYTKAKLCGEAGISRPTLDKLLSGTLTNKTNYEKHMSKVLDCLSLTPDMLLGNVPNGYNRARVIRDMMRIASEEIAERTGISLERLKEIESGAEATTAELRDVAYCLSTNVSSLLGTGFFNAQLASYVLFEKKEAEGISGFWGHIGILPLGQEKYIWFPITEDTHRELGTAMEEERIVISCMNDRALLLNMENIKEIVLLDDACDQPADINWDPDVDEGATPLVVYEAFEDYYMAYLEEEEVPADVMSPSLKQVLDSFCQQKGGSPEEIYRSIHDMIVHYIDGKSRVIDIDLGAGGTLAGEIAAIYSFGADASENAPLSCYDRNGAEVMINTRNVALLELPLLEVEDAICREMDAILR